MSDVFLQLSAEDRIEALATAAAESGRPAHLLEKDVWVVWALRALFEAPLGEALVFKGGTSLSKAYDVIQRFSEDIDLTYDIRRLLPDLADASEDPVPATRAEERRWSRDVQRLLPLWVEGEVRPMLEARLTADGVAAKVRIERAKAFVDYAPTSTGTGYVSPSVMLEFGARATGEAPASRGSRYRRRHRRRAEVHPPAECWCARFASRRKATRQGRGSRGRPRDTGGRRADGASQAARCIDTPFDAPGERNRLSPCTSGVGVPDHAVQQPLLRWEATWSITHGT